MTIILIRYCVTVRKRRPTILGGRQPGGHGQDWHLCLLLGLPQQGHRLQKAKFGGRRREDIRGKKEAQNGRKQHPRGQERQGGHGTEDEDLGELDHSQGEEGGGGGPDSEVQVVRSRGLGHVEEGDHDGQGGHQQVDGQYLLPSLVDRQKVPLHLHCRSQQAIWHPGRLGLRRDMKDYNKF